MAGKNYSVDKAHIAARIDRLLDRVGDATGQNDKQVNVGVGKALHVSGEAVRQWRKGVVLPRLEKLDALVTYLTQRKVDSAPESILFGTPSKDLTSMDVRQRIVEEGPELDLLRAFRATSPEGQKRILDYAETILKAFPRPMNVQVLHRRKK